MSDDTQLPDGVDESEREAFEVWVANGNDGDDADGFRENYIGNHYANLAEYVEETLRDTSEIPDWLDYYVDWELMARDWELNGDVWTERTPNGFYIFRNY